MIFIMIITNLLRIVFLSILRSWQKRPKMVTILRNRELAQNIQMRLSPVGRFLSKPYLKKISRLFFLSIVKINNADL